VPTAENARLEMEAGQSQVAMAPLTDSGDHLKFTGAGGGMWSDARDKAPLILPNGVRSGGLLTPTAVVNQVAVAALELNLNGVVTAVAGANVTVTRTAAGAAFQKSSVTVTSAGALAAVAGLEGPAFSDTRAAAGGPPLIAVDAVEIGQVWFSSNTDAVVQPTEIKQIPGTHVERANFPVYQIDRYSGAVTMVQALPLSHTGPITKRIYAEFYIPDFAPLSNVNTVVLPEKTYALNSTPTYDGPIGSTTSSLGQGSFTILLDDGINDLVAIWRGQNLWFRFKPDRYKAAKAVFQGYLGIARAYPADGNISANCTISAEKEGADLSS
jgi:hypothetical protein